MLAKYKTVEKIIFAFIKAEKEEENESEVKSSFGTQ